MLNGNPFFLELNFYTFLEQNQTIVLFFSIQTLKLEFLVNLLNLNKCVYRILLSLNFLIDLGMNQLLLPSSSFATLSFQHRLNFLTSKIIDWNQHHFGNIFQSKKRTYARLKGLQFALASRPNAFFFN